MGLHSKSTDRRPKQRYWDHVKWGWSHYPFTTFVVASIIIAFLCVALILLSASFDMTETGALGALANPFAILLQAAVIVFSLWAAPFTGPKPPNPE